MTDIALLTELTKIGPRVGENETKALNALISRLNKKGIPHSLQPFSVEVPICTHAELIVDGVAIPCLGSSIVSGEIPDAKYLISHFGYSGDPTPYNIAYSPMTDFISVVDHFRVPSITISRKSVVEIIMGQKITGKVEVKKTKINTGNILVGNATNPQNLVFAHFDSIIGPGAVDNAGSVVTMFEVISEKRQLLDTALFIFSGNEEMAYDDYKLSGYGFRVFENQYSHLLKKATQVVVMDGLGMLPAKWSQSGLDWVLQIKMLDSIREKVFWLQSEQTPVLTTFHTTDDIAANIQTKYVQSAKNLLINKIS